MRAHRCSSLVCNGGAARAAEGQYGNALKARLGAPAPKVCGSEIEGIAELEQHGQRHEQAEDVRATLVIDQVLDGDEDAASRQGLVRGADQRFLLLEVPVVQDH